MSVSNRTFILLTSCAVIAFGLGYAIAISTHEPTQGTQEENENYSLLAKRLFVNSPNDTRINFSPLRSTHNKHFADNNIKGSLYFEYLPTGTSVRVNPDIRYRAASLIKLPVAMELYKAQELGKLTIDQRVTLKEEWLNDSYGTLYKKGPGYQLSLREASEIMLKESDNTALRILVDANQVLDTSNRALGSLDIELTTQNDGSIDIGTRSYSSFLKCLYFSCYNSKEDSQAILKLLTETPFRNRIAAGISDSTIPVAHKIGVFNSQVQSDCGIVYVPNNNYVLCVMLEGDDNQATNNKIAEISKIVYEFVKH